MQGRTLGHYEIIEPLGVGGMGEVYRAHDTTLKRYVAIKLLPEELAGDPERLARLEREAHLLAYLNHPGIAAIHSLEEADGVRFLVLELVEGDTLAVRLERGRLEVEEALELARQIAEALEAAHNQGIIHRDLKPQNIKLTPEGKVKVLDFGLAKAFEAEGEASEEELTHSPTVTVKGTHTGVILGTAAYMSPEQAKGKPLDQRTDIWSFGCVLYEILTGRRPFVGEDVSETLASILKEKPDWSALPATTPVTARALLRRCLRKDPDGRLHHIADARIEIDEALSEPEAVLPGVAAMAAQTPLWRRVFFWALVAWGLGATLLALRLVSPWSGSTDIRPPVVRFALLAPDPFNRSPSVSVSKNGNHVAYTAEGAESQSQLWIRALDSPVARAVPGTDGAIFPFWAPDESAVAFFAHGRLMRIDLATGALQVVCEAPNGRGGTWSQAGIIVFAPDGTGPLYQVRASGGQATPVTTLDTSQGEWSHRFPHFLADGRSFTYYESRDSVVYRASIDSPGRTLLVNGDSEAFPIPGYLLFVRDRTLMAQPYDESTGQAGGEAFPLIADLRANKPVGNGEFAVSANGVLVYRAHPTVETQLVWFDRSGSRLAPISDSGIHQDFDLSLDGERVAFTRRDLTGTSNIWVLDTERDRRSQVTASGGGYPVISPDGSAVLFHRSGTLYRKRLSVGAREEKLHEHPEGFSLRDPHWSVDGQSIVFISWDGITDFDVWMLSEDDDPRAHPILRERGDQTSPRVSPDRRWIAYVSNHSGQNEVYVISYPDLSRVIPISTAGGVEPRWRRDGNELFYRSPSGSLMAVEVEQGDFGLPEELFEAVIADQAYAVDGTGERFLLAIFVGEDPSRNINIILNWFEELRLRVPTGGTPYFHRTSSRRRSPPQLLTLNGGLARMKSARRSGCANRLAASVFPAPPTPREWQSPGRYTRQTSARPGLPLRCCGVHMVSIETQNPAKSVHTIQGHGSPIPNRKS